MISYQGWKLLIDENRLAKGFDSPAICTYRFSIIWTESWQNFCKKKNKGTCESCRSVSTIVIGHVYSIITKTLPVAQQDNFCYIWSHTSHHFSSHQVSYMKSWPIFREKSIPCNGDRGSYTTGHCTCNLWNKPLVSFIWNDHGYKILFIIWRLFLACLNNVQEELLYYPHPCSQMLTFYIKVFRTSLFFNSVMDLVHV